MTTSATAPLDPNRPDVLPGYVLSKPRLRDYGTVEEQLSRRYYSGVLTDAAELPEAVRDSVVAAVLREIRARHFAFGSRSFDAAAFHPANLPLLLYTCLRVKHPQLTYDQAADLIKDDNEVAVRAAVLELWGYDLTPAPKKKEGEPTSEKGDPGTGGDSPNDSSATPGSPSPTSPT